MCKNTPIFLSEKYFYRFFELYGNFVRDARWIGDVHERWMGTGLEESGAACVMFYEPPPSLSRRL
jgi:hypothetical protein